MNYDARSLSTEEQYLLRKIAVQRVLDGEAAIEVNRSLGLGGRTIYKWLKTYREGGFEALAPVVRIGRNRTLSEVEEQEVKRWIVGQDPRQHGFDFGLWTREIVANLILDRFNIKLSISSVGRMLHRLGLTPQKPLRRAYERNDDAIKKWKEEDYPSIKKVSKQQGGEIFWLDEASIRSDDPLQRTWGLKGETPIVNTSGQRQSINAISALSNSGGFWYHIFTGRFNADKFIECLKNLLKNRRRFLHLIVDGHPVHKSKKVREFLESKRDRVALHILPPYAPDLNPDELVWNQMRHMGTSKKPLKKGESLKDRARNDLELIKSNKALIRSFFREPNVSFAAA